MLLHLRLTCVTFTVVRLLHLLQVGWTVDRAINVRALAKALRYVLGHDHSIVSVPLSLHAGV